MEELAQGFGLKKNIFNKLRDLANNINGNTIVMYNLLFYSPKSCNTFPFISLMSQN